MSSSVRRIAIVSAALQESRIAVQGLRQLLAQYNSHIIKGNAIVPELSNLDSSLAQYWNEHQKQVVFDQVAGIPWVPIVGVVPGGVALFFAAAKLAPKLLPATFQIARHFENAPAADEQAVSALVRAVRGRAEGARSGGGTLSDSEGAAGSQVSMSSLDYTVLQRLGYGVASPSLSLARATQRVSAWSSYLVAEDGMLLTRLATGKNILQEALGAALKHRILAGSIASLDGAGQLQLLQVWLAACRELEAGGDNGGDTAAPMHPTTVRHLLLRHAVASGNVRTAVPPASR